MASSSGSRGREQHAFSDDESGSDDASESADLWPQPLTQAAAGSSGVRELSSAPRPKKFVSFATDLVAAFDVVRKRSTTSVKTCDEVVHLLRMRISVEEAYAKGLEKCASHDFPSADDGETAKEALEALRTDLLNKAVQHRELAARLQDDVLESFSGLRGQMTGKHKALLARVARLQKDAKGAEDRYRRAHARYERSFRDAATAVVASAECGAPPPRLDPAKLFLDAGASEDGYVSSPLPGEHKSPPGHAVPLGDASTSGGSISSDRSGGGGFISSAASFASVGFGGGGGEGRGGGGRRRYMSAFSDKMRDAMPHPNKDIVQWLLPTERQRKEALAEAAQTALEDAEAARSKCRVAWGVLCDVLAISVRELQHVLTDFQGMEERLVADLQDGLRKAVVFESSALANQQYDSQKLFQVLEAMSSELDLKRFIVAGRAAGAAVAGGEAEVRVTEAARLDGSLSTAIFQRVFLMGPDLPPPPPDAITAVPTSLAAPAPLAPEALTALLQHLPLISPNDVAACLGIGNGNGFRGDFNGGSADGSAVVSAASSPGGGGGIVVRFDALAALNGAGDSDYGGGGGGGGSGGGGGGGGVGVAGGSSTLSPPGSPMVVSAANMLEVLSLAEMRNRAAQRSPGSLGGGSLDDGDHGGTDNDSLGSGTPPPLEGPLSGRRCGGSGTERGDGGGSGNGGSGGGNSTGGGGCGGDGSSNAAPARAAAGAAATESGGELLL